MKRPLAFALLLYVIGAGFYLALSRGPLRVQLVTVPTQFLLLIGGVLIAWWGTLSRPKRTLALISFVLVVAGLDSWLSSKVIAALTPFQIAYYYTTAVALLVEVFLFVGIVWGLDRLFRRLPSTPLLILLLLVACSSARGIVEPEVISRPTVEYPENLRRAGVGGLVRIEAVIGSDGVPRDIKVLATDDDRLTDPRLEKLSIETLSRWRFKPAMRNGHPVEQRYVTAIIWKAEDK